MSNQGKVAVQSTFIVDLLNKAIELNASDIHISEGKRPSLRIDSNLVDLTDFEKWQAVHIQAFLTLLRIPNAFDDRDSVNTSFTLSGKRFRFHGFRTFTGISIALRIIPLEIPKFENLNLNPSVAKLVERKSGLVLVTGATGSGKSTTLASLIDIINHHQSDRKLVITIENPIEFVYNEVQARIIQREVGKNVRSIGDAIIDAMREDPDIILIGELTDKEAIKNAITLADTGHLVLASLHTNGAAETFDRIMDAFETDNPQIRAKLANSLQGIVHQELIPKIGGGRVPLTEILTVEDSDIRHNLLSNTTVKGIQNLMKDNPSKGLVNLERSAALLVHQNLITMDTAVKYSKSTKENINRIINQLR